MGTKEEELKKKADELYAEFARIYDAAKEAYGYSNWLDLIRGSYEAKLKKAIDELKEEVKK